jgi:hypothetical protein
MQVGRARSYASDHPIRAIGVDGRSGDRSVIGRDRDAGIRNDLTFLVGRNDGEECGSALNDIHDSALYHNGQRVRLTVLQKECEEYVLQQVLQPTT